MHESHYEAQKRAAQRLRIRHAVAPPPATRYLEAEIDFVLQRIPTRASVLELGCGYGRVLARLEAHTHQLFGIDISVGSLLAAQEFLGPRHRCHLAAADACSLAFPEGSFDVILCIQNSLSVFRGDPVALVREAVRVAKPNCQVMLSSFSKSFWPERIAWFEAQVAQGLRSEIDYNATGNGVIVGTNGSRSSAIDADEFRELASEVGIVPEIHDVEGSSLFCVLRVP